MDNPYEPPTADIDDGTIATPSKLKWKIFFWVLASLEGLSMIYNFVYPEEQGLGSIIGELIVYSLILTGLFGFAYNKKILFQKFWRYLIPAGIGWDVYTIFLTGYFEVTEEYELYILIGTLVILVLPILIFQYLALFFYSYKSENIWS